MKPPDFRFLRSDGKDAAQKGVRTTSAKQTQTNIEKFAGIFFLHVHIPKTKLRSKETLCSLLMCNLPAPRQDAWLKTRLLEFLLYLGVTNGLWFYTQPIPP
jgi:hypothetical protein